MMNAEQTLLAARPDSSRLNDDSLPLLERGADDEREHDRRARRAPPTQMAGRPAICCQPSQMAIDRAERRAGGDAERVRRRQRIAQHRLKQRAGQ